LFIPCGRLSWLPLSFLLHVKYTVSYRIVIYRFRRSFKLGDGLPTIPTVGKTKRRKIKITRSHNADTANWSVAIESAQAVGRTSLEHATDVSYKDSKCQVKVSLFLPVCRACMCRHGSQLNDEMA